MDSIDNLNKQLCGLHEDQLLPVFMLISPLLCSLDTCCVCEQAEAYVNPRIYTNNHFIHPKCAKHKVTSSVLFCIHFHMYLLAKAVHLRSEEARGFYHAGVVKIR